MAIGSDFPRVDGHGKLTGATKYIDDITLPGMLHGGTVRSQVARGRIKAIHFDPAIDWSSYIIVDRRDIPGVNEIAFLEHEQPALAFDAIHHKHEPILLLAHENPGALRRGLKGVRVEIEPLTPVLDPETPLTDALIQYKHDNVFKRIEIRKGDPAGIFAQAAHVISGEYRTGAQEHVYLENQGMIAYLEDEKIVVMGTMQCPYYVVKGMTHLFQKPETAFRIIQTPTGGGFGGKEDYPSIIAIHAALLAIKAKRPVKIVYDREEDMACTTKRHPSIVRHKTALDAEGHLLAMEIDVILDSGAFVTLSPVVLSRGAIHAAGPYHCEHVAIVGEARLTNKVPFGAFRGFGAPQTLFATERHMDHIARTLGIDPVELRRRNLLKVGELTATGQVMKDPVDLIALQGRALAAADYEARTAAHAKFNLEHPYLRRGIGFATFFHGAGFTGSGEVFLASEAWVEGTADGCVEVLVANTDIGQGTETVMMQIVCNTLGIPLEKARVARPDTSRVPNSGPTVASRTVMIVGKLVERACLDLLAKARAGGEAQAGAEDAITVWHAAHPGERLLGVAKYQKPENVTWDDVNYRGEAYATYAWACYVADVELDLRTYGARVTDFVALQEVGKVIAPRLAEGQIQGGVVQGIGWALMEEIVERDGAMANNQMTNYIIPTSGDLPPIRVIFEETENPFGPSGAKGIGELPMDGPAPAIINAICNATGVEFNEIPLTPERMMQSMDSFNKMDKISRMGTG